MALESYDHIIGLEARLDVAVDGCITKARDGGQSPRIGRNRASNVQWP